jgi:hypothetical protein
MLLITCPHCRHESHDEFEVLDAHRLHEFTCETCQKPYTFFNIDCQCGEETQLAFGNRPSIEGLRALVCSMCARPSEVFDGS